MGDTDAKVDSALSTVTAILHARNVEIPEQRCKRLVQLLKGCQNNSIPSDFVFAHLRRMHDVGSYLELGSAEILEHLKWLVLLGDSVVLVSNVTQTLLPRIQPDTTEYRFLVVGRDGYLVLNAITDAIADVGLEISGGRSFTYDPVQPLKTRKNALTIRNEDRFICEFSVISTDSSVKEENLHKRLQDRLKKRLTPAVDSEIIRGAHSPIDGMDGVDTDDSFQSEGTMPNRSIAPSDLRELRKVSGVALSEFAHLLLDSSVEDVRAWESGTEPIPDCVRSYIVEIRAFLELLRPFVPQDQFPVWLTSPLPVLSNRCPLDEIASGQVARVRRSIERLQRGTFV